MSTVKMLFECEGCKTQGLAPGEVLNYIVPNRTVYESGCLEKSLGIPEQSLVCAQCKKGIVALLPDLCANDPDFTLVAKDLTFISVAQARTHLLSDKIASQLKAPGVVSYGRFPDDLPEVFTSVRGQGFSTNIIQEVQQAHVPFSSPRDQAMEKLRLAPLRYKPDEKDPRCAVSGEAAVAQISNGAAKWLHSFKGWYVGAELCELLKRARAGHSLNGGYFVREVLADVALVAPEYQKAPSASCLCCARGMDNQRAIFKLKSDVLGAERVGALVCVSCKWRYFTNLVATRPEASTTLEAYNELGEEHLELLKGKAGGDARFQAKKVGDAIRKSVANQNLTDGSTKANAALQERMAFKPLRIKD